MSVLKSKYPIYARSGGTIILVMIAAASAMLITAFFLKNPRMHKRFFSDAAVVIVLKLPFLAFKSSELLPQLGFRLLQRTVFRPHIPHLLRTDKARARMPEGYHHAISEQGKMSAFPER